MPCQKHQPLNLLKYKHLFELSTADRNLASSMHYVYSNTVSERALLDFEKGE